MALIPLVNLLIGNYSRKAIEGLIAHELAHCFTITRKWPNEIPSEIPKDFNLEIVADEQAKKWGFEEELEEFEQYNLKQRLKENRERYDTGAITKEEYQKAKETIERLLQK